jgi:Oxygen-sensitive ribonucleoside-triphosphate reductase
MTTQERNNIENKISELKTKLENTKGSNCEVYSRVVGYLRPVQNWNKGKKEEFAMRKNMKMSCGCGSECSSDYNNTNNTNTTNSSTNTTNNNSNTNSTNCNC